MIDSMCVCLGKFNWICWGRAWKNVVHFLFWVSFFQSLLFSSIELIFSAYTFHCLHRKHGLYSLNFKVEGAV